MPIYLDEVDIGQQRMQAVGVFFQTVNRLKQVRRDKELTIGFNQIDRDADIQIEEILSTQEPEQQEYYIGQIKRNARRRKMDMMAQAGEFEPVRPKQGGAMGFIQNILRAFSPTDTTGVTDTPLIQQIQTAMMESQFPSIQDELSQEYMRERIKYTEAQTKKVEAEADPQSEKSKYSRSSHKMRLAEGMLQSAWTLENMIPVDATDEEIEEMTKEVESLRGRALQLYRDADSLMKGVSRKDLSDKLRKQADNVIQAENKRRIDKSPTSAAIQEAHIPQKRVTGEFTTAGTPRNPRAQIYKQQIDYLKLTFNLNPEEVKSVEKLLDKGVSLDEITRHLQSKSK
jgi:hypothetical protein